jgi:hypothetical protein
LQVISLAKSFDFTLGEIRLFFEGLSDEGSPRAIWRAFANAKMKILEDQITRAKHLRQILKIGISCQCIRLSLCTLADMAPTKA